MFSTVAINKAYAIAATERRIAEHCAARASAFDYLATPGQDDAFYEWHERTLKAIERALPEMQREIESIRSAPWHEWN